MFAPLQNDTFLRACLRQATDHTPVWLMRQAGRYLPEYRATRAQAGSFMGLATNTDYATEVTLQPLARYPLDAAILFSDILTVPDAMGLGLSFALGEGPRFATPVRDEAAVAKLEVPDMNKLRYVFDAVTSTRAYKESWSPGQALEWMTQADGHFDRRMFVAFRRLVGAFPVGTLVRLSSDRLGVVVDGGNTGGTAPPVVTFYCTATNQPLPWTRIESVSDPIRAIERPEIWHLSNWESLRDSLLEFAPA